MEENKNQTIDTGPDGIVVKDYDGNFKVLNDGELKDLDALLTSTINAPGMMPQIASSDPHGGAVAFPKFTDLAPVPQDEHFQSPEIEKKTGAIAELHFHPDDKQEIERELEKLNTAFGLTSQKQYSITKIAQKLVDKHTLKFSEQELSAFTKIVLSYFRQARSLVETRSKLIEAKASGGMGVPADIADHMVAVLKHLKEKIEETDGIVVEAEELPAVPVMPKITPRKEPSKPAPAPVATVEPQVTKVQPEAVASKPISAPRVEPAIVAPAPAPIAPSIQPESKIPKEESLAKAAPEAPSVQQPQIEDAPKINRPPVATFKPPMIEIKRPQSNAVRSGKPTGRVDELALMDLATWRILDPDPRIRAGKILGKIQNLEQESLTRKSQGIQAWRSNEVYQYYLMLGQLSLERKKDVADIIQELTAQGQQTLTLAEFEAVSDLNRMIRF